MSKRNLLLYPSLVLGGVLLTLGFQNCTLKSSSNQQTSPLVTNENASEITGETSDKTASSLAGLTAPERARTPSSNPVIENPGEGPQPKMTPLQASIVNASGWELIGLSIDGEDTEIPEVDPIVLDLQPAGVNLQKKAQEQSKGRVLFLYHVTLHQVCSPIVGNDLGITEEGLNDLAGSPYSVKGLKPISDKVYAASEDCSDDTENQSRRKISRELSGLVKAANDSRVFAFERRGQNLIVTHRNVEMTFAPL